MLFFKQLFCKHNHVHHFNHMMALNDDWPCMVYADHKCTKCGHRKVVGTMVGR